MILIPRPRNRGGPSCFLDRRQLLISLDVPQAAAGLVLLAQACGHLRSGLLRHGIAPVLRSTGLATCVVDLLEPAEAAEPFRLTDVDFLANRLTGIVEFLGMNRATGRLPLVILGRDEAAIAAIRVAAEQPHRVRAVVSCAGWPHRAGIDFANYRIPTLLLVPGGQRSLARANEKFFLQLHCESQLAVIQDGRRIGESVTLAACQKVIHSWCVRYLGISDELPRIGESPRKMRRRRGRAAFLGALVHG